MIDYTAQDRYDDDFREWRKTNQDHRLQEAEEVEKALSELEDTLNEDYLNERERRELTEWKWRLERRLHDLIRWEHDNLEWEWRLKRQTARRETRVEGHNGYRRPTELPATGIRKNRQHKKRSHTAKKDVQN